MRKFSRKPFNTQLQDSGGSDQEFCSRPRSTAIEPRKLRTSNSIPYKPTPLETSEKQKSLVSPSLLITYRLPNSPEKYLLPIRFPILYANIIKNLLKRSKSFSKTNVIRQRINHHNGIISLA